MLLPTCQPLPGPGHARPACCEALSTPGAARLSRNQGGDALAWWSVSGLESLLPALPCPPRSWTLSIPGKTSPELSEAGPRQSGNAFGPWVSSFTLLRRNALLEVLKLASPWSEEWVHNTRVLSAEAGRDSACVKALSSAGAGLEVSTSRAAQGSAGSP